MALMSFADLLGWIALALGALIVAFFLGYGLVRWRLVRRIDAALGPGKMMLASAARVRPLKGVNGQGPAGEEPDRVGGSGLIMLVAGGLYFHTWLGDKELFVAGPSITYIGVADSGGRPLSAGASRRGRRGSREPAARSRRGPITLRYLNNEGKEEGSTISLLYPEQWAEAIRTHLIGRSA